jgi:membrane protein implicated in regulation of membrane protease activity
MRFRIWDNGGMATNWNKHSAIAGYLACVLAIVMPFAIVFFFQPVTAQGAGGPTGGVGLMPTWLLLVIVGVYGVVAVTAAVLGFKGRSAQAAHHEARADLFREQAQKLEKDLERVKRLLLKRQIEIAKLSRQSTRHEN